MISGGDREAPGTPEADRASRAGMPYAYVANELQDQVSYKELRHRKSSQDCKASTPKSASAVSLAKTFAAMRKKISEIEKPNWNAPGPTSLGSGGVGSVGGLDRAASTSVGDSGFGQSFDALRDSFQKPVAFLREKSRPRLYDTDRTELGFKLPSHMDPRDLLPLVVVFIIIVSSMVTVFTLTGGLTNNRSGRNGKYKSIEFGHEMSKRGRDRLPKDLVDEEGNALGGKRAAMQFAHEMKHRVKREVAAPPPAPPPAPVEKEEAPEEEEVAPEETIDHEELLDSLEFLKELRQLAAVREAVDERPEGRSRPDASDERPEDRSRPDASDERPEDRSRSDASPERLLRELTSFGHFGTSAVRRGTVGRVPEPEKAADEADVPPGGSPETKEAGHAATPKKKSKKRSDRSSKSSRGLPFRFRKKEPMSPAETGRKTDAKLTEENEPELAFRLNM